VPMLLGGELASAAPPSPLTLTERVSLTVDGGQRAGESSDAVMSADACTWGGWQDWRAR